MAKNSLTAILMAAGAEKLQSEARYSFTLADGESKILPIFWNDKDTDGESNTDLDLSTNYAAQRVLWKSRCAGGYYFLAGYNNDTNGALLGLTWLTLNKQNYDDFDSVYDIQTNIDNSKTSVISAIVQDILKDDDLTRNFVPHIKFQPLAAKQMHWEEGVMSSGKKTAPWTNPYVKALIISNMTPLTTSSVTLQFGINFYQYAPGITTSSRSVQLGQDV